MSIPPRFQTVGRRRWRAVSRRRVLIWCWGVGVWGACVIATSAQASEQPESLLVAALEAGDPLRLDRALAQGAPVDTALPSGERPLINALRRRRNDQVSICLDWCADWRAARSDQPDALTLAVITQNAEAAAMLLSSGADPNASLPSPAPTEVRAAFSDVWFGEQLRTDP